MSRSPRTPRLLSRDEFLDEFCLNGFPDELDARWLFAEPFRSICKWAEDAGATSIVIGGSFITKKPDPDDIDVLILFKRSHSVRKCTESMFLKEVRLDIQILAEDQPEMLSAFLFLFGRSKSGVKVDPVQIKLHPSQATLRIPSAEPILFECVRDAYEGRMQIHVHRSKGLIIPIHGINTRAEWLQYFALVATSSGWGFAPFIYGREWLTTLVNPARRRALVENFRIWVNEIRKVYDGPICIFAHSLGSYIFARYLASMGDLEERFCGVAFSGSIVTKEFDWAKHIGAGRITAVQNTKSSQDFWVGLMREGGFWPLGRDELYGRAGSDGFAQCDERIQQVEVDLLTHTNQFQRDLIQSMWMPFFEYSLRLYDNAPWARRP